MRARERRAERDRERRVLRRRGGRGAGRPQGTRRRPDVAVVDPPRAGLSGKALRRLARLEPRRIVYVSCNPTTLAGNVKELEAEWGYRLVRARPVDMFPHTPHIETVALLERG